jgi:hypothetical protein
MSAIKNYWYAVQRRVEETENMLGSVATAAGPTLIAAARPVADMRDVVATPENDAVVGLHVSHPPHFYFYKSIRFHREPGEWGVFVVTGGRDLIAERFLPYCGSADEAERAANEFLMACGKAHYQFDVFAMSLEANQRRWLYVPYRHASRSLTVPRLETAFVHQAAMVWAAKHRLSSPVAKILERWTSNTVVHDIPQRPLGAYLATALAEGFGALVGPARYDQAEWTSFVPESLWEECPGPHVLERPLAAENKIADAMQTNPTPEEWLSRWGVRDYRKLQSGEYCIAESLTIFGDAFADGQFPFRICEVAGDFVCQETNLSRVEGLPTIIGGRADISRNRHLRNLSRIHRYVKSVRGGVLRVSEELVDAGVLGLLRIEGVNRIEVTVDAVEPVARSWARILNKHFPLAVGENPALIKCQNELIAAGLENHGAI